jgi:hypothetical protein
MQKVNDAKQLLAGAQSLFQGFAHRNDPIHEGLGEESFVEDWKTEGRDVWMFSGEKHGRPLPKFLLIMYCQCRL